MTEAYCETFTLKSEEVLRKNIAVSIEEQHPIPAILLAILDVLREETGIPEPHLKDKIITLLPDNFKVYNIPPEWFNIECFVSSKYLCEFNELIDSVKEYATDKNVRAQLLFAFLRERATISRYANSLSNENKRFIAAMLPFRKAGKQYIADFSVKDIGKPITNSYNFHGQNTSQWVYAGCILLEDRNGEVQISCHH